MKSVGLDIATKVGLAIVGEGEDRGKLVKFPDLNGFKRLQSIASEVERVLLLWEPDVIMIEGYAFGQYGSLVTLVEVGTVIRQMLYRNSWYWFEVPPTTLKKWTTGKGNADKAAMAKAVAEKWKYESPSHDIIDAYALAQMGQLPADQLSAIKGVISGV